MKTIRTVCIDSDRLRSSIRWMSAGHYQTHWRLMRAFALPSFRIDLAGHERKGTGPVSQYATWAARSKRCCASAFLQPADASVLILDEPTTSLSAQAEYELFCRTFARPNDNSNFSSVFHFKYRRSHPGDGQRPPPRIRHASGIAGAGRQLCASLPVASKPAEIDVRG